MKPHPRIRKTVKWGGAVVCVLSVGLWLVGLRWSWSWVGGDVIVASRRGSIHVLYQRAMRAPYPSGWYAGLPTLPIDVYILPRWIPRPGGWQLVLPCLVVAAVSGAAGATAWRFDTLARRRARAHLCPKCRYDRTGLAPGVVCPECGAAAVTA